MPALVKELEAALSPLKLPFEIVFVDDGSDRRTKELLAEAVRSSPNIAVVELSRNFGQQAAFFAGLEHATGNAVVVMDCDLQDPPSALPMFIEKWREGFDVVYAIREKRKEGWVKRLAYLAFYRLLRVMARIELPLDAGDFCLMDRRVVSVLSSLEERARFLRGLRSWVGLRQIGIRVERQARNSGDAKYTYGKLFNLALDGLVSFSFVPLRAISLIGAVISVFSILLAIFYAVKKLVEGLHPPGFATTVVMILFFAGVQLLTIGVIGEYVGRIFEEVKRRPSYIVNAVRRGGPRT